ncbi:anaerobic dehydrogenase, typically selenocysteine-containing [SAR116 cluster alpha proteobacterium HIMB100]|nr:anaerobic dehydrogenase, typically selenocysteine-containing [SAR116 cluster alpha proteobacterium HIMB100]
MPLTSSHWGTYNAIVKDGRLVDMAPFAEDADPSAIGKGLVGAVDGPTRITAPMVRKDWLEGRSGRRGADEFVEVSWELAEQLVADELTRVKAEQGNQAIFAGCYGWASAGRFHHAQSQIHRFMNCIGGYVKSVNTYSFAAAEVIIPHVLGDFRGFIYDQTSWQSICDEGELFVGFGGLPLKNAQINQGGTGGHVQKGFATAAYDAGVRFVNISPLATDMPDELDADWLPVRPNTDTALILGLCHTLLDEGLHDTGFLARYCVGFDAFAGYLDGTADGLPKTASWAADICGLPADDIRALARRMATSRTMISLSWSLTRQAHGEQPMWAGIVLAAMLGQIGRPGGGVGIGYSAVNRVGYDLHRLSLAALPQGINPVKDFIPVARITDMLTRPGTDFDYNGGTYSYPDIKLIYWAGGNPFHHHQDLARLVDAWQIPQTVIVHDWCWNSLARHADIVLPVTTPVERRDIAMTPIDPYLVSMEQAILPVGLARDDYDIFTALSRRLGVEEAFTEGRTAEDWQRWLYEVSQQRLAQSGLELPSYDQFRAAGWHKLPLPDTPHVMFADFRADPDAHPLKTPSGRIEIFSETVAGFSYQDCPGHPVWLAPPEWLGTADKDYPLHLLSNQPRTKLHSQLDQGPVSAAAKIKGREEAFMHPDDAVARQIEEGQIIRIFNARGAIYAGVRIIDHIRPGVVVVPTGAWLDPDPDTPSLCKHGNPNMLTPDRPTSKLAQGPAAHSCLVQAETVDQNSLPPVTAFIPPEILPETAPEITSEAGS